MRNSYTLVSIKFSLICDMLGTVDIRNNSRCFYFWRDYSFISWLSLQKILFCIFEQSDVCWIEWCKNYFDMLNQTPRGSSGIDEVKLGSEELKILLHQIYLCFTWGENITIFSKATSLSSFLEKIRLPLANFQEGNSCPIWDTFLIFYRRKRLLWRKSLWAKLPWRRHWLK